MITILLGGDTFAKQKEIAGRLPAKEFEVVRISESSQIPPLSSLSEPTLFGPPRAYIFSGVWKDLDPEKLLEFGASSQTKIFIDEDSLDQRKSSNKEILKDERITVIDCAAPKGEESRAWIKDHAKTLDMQIDNQAATDLARALVPEEYGSLSVTSAHNELMKLKSYANGEIVTSEMVAELVEPLLTINVFDLLDAVGSQQKPRALQLLNQFYERTDGDEKAKTIQLTALLADQMRNMLLVLDAAAQRIPDTEILKQTGWKSGRLFIMKKLARSFTPAKIRQSLNKLESLDLEVKSSTMPTHVVLDLIIAAM
jgi:DNA polymerase III subunit delta